MKKNSWYRVGIDWGDSEHAVYAFRPDTEEYERFRVSHSPEGLRELVSRIQALGPVAGVAVETTRNLLVTALLQAGLPVYAINPKVSKDWRKAYGVSGAKSDQRDARVLAEGLWHHEKRLCPLVLSSDAMRELAQWCEDEKKFIDERTTVVQQLRATLKQYHPQMEAFFEDWTAPSAWDFLLAFPTPEALAKASKSTLCRFLRARHIGLRPCWQERIENRQKALEWPCDARLVPALALRAKVLAETLRVLEKHLREYRQRIEELFGGMDNAELFESLPGAGPKIAPRLMAMFGDNPAQYDSAQTLRQLSGVAPVMFESGKKKCVVIRRACRKYWRNTLHQFAHHSAQYCAWARAFYDLCRKKKDTNATALRKLAGKWLKIIFRMWSTGTCYDDARYVESLRRRNSETYRHMLNMGYA